MKAMTDVLILLVAFVAGILAILYYYWYASAPDIAGERSAPYLYTAIAATVVACIAIVFYFLRHVNKEEEIHITQ